MMLGAAVGAWWRLALASSGRERALSMIGAMYLLLADSLTFLAPRQALTLVIATFRVSAGAGGKMAPRRYAFFYYAGLHHENGI